MQNGGKNLLGIRKQGAKVCAYVCVNTSTVLSLTDRCWIVMRESRSRNICVPYLTMIWSHEVEGDPVTGLISQVCSSTLWWTSMSLNKTDSDFTHPCFSSGDFLIVQDCIRFLSNSIFLENLWEKQFTKWGCACLFCSGFTTFWVLRFDSWILTNIDKPGAIHGSVWT